MKHRCLYILLCFLFFSPLLKGQNLIPNPGFEEFEDDSVFFWQQPSPPFYHFTVDPFTSYSGNAYNGLCLWKYNPSEFLSVALSQPLKKGQVYRYSMFFKTDKNFSHPANDSVSKVGVFFKVDVPDTRYKHVSEEMPGIVMHTLDVNDWRQVSGLYLAKGGERYLQLGYFSAMNSAEEVCGGNVEVNKEYQVLIDQLRVQKDQYYLEALDSIKDKYVMDPRDCPRGRKKREAFERELRWEREAYQKEVQLVREKIDAWYLYMLKFIEQRNDPGHVRQARNCNCQMRYYFDDLVLVPVDEADLNTRRLVYDNIYFDTDKYEVKPDSYRVLDEIYEYLQSEPEVLIRVEGHTDNQGGLSYNYKLSANRAEAIVQYLIDKGIAPQRIVSMGVGSDKPLASNATEQGRAKNRRVEMLLVLP